VPELGRWSRRLGIELPDFWIPTETPIPGPEGARSGVSRSEGRETTEPDVDQFFGKFESCLSKL